jgi:hypothetical protein
MNLNNDVVDRRFRLGPLYQRHPGRSRSLVRHHDRFHLDTSVSALAYTPLWVCNCYRRRTSMSYHADRCEESGRYDVQRRGMTTGWGRSLGGAVRGIMAGRN